MSEKRTSLAELALLFLKLGTIAFGGPAAHIAMMEDEVVRCRQWLLRDDFLDLLGATNLIPGPNSTEMAIHIGHRRAGWAGLLVAGCCFILPATLIVGVISWTYVRFGSLPQAKGLLYGVKPVVLVIVLQAVWRLGRSALKTKLLLMVGLAGAALNFLDGVNVASLALMAVVMVQLTRAAFVDLPTIVIGSAAAFLLLRYKLNSTWLVLGGTMAGNALHDVRLEQRRHNHDGRDVRLCAAGSDGCQWGRHSYGQ